MLDAAPAYSAFAGILGGFLFLGIVTLMTERRYPQKTADRSRSLMLFLPAFLSLLISSFLFGEVSGEQICARGYITGIFASSFLAVGALGVLSGVGWMLEAYGQSNDDLRRTSVIFIYLGYFTVIASLLAFSTDIIDDAFDNNPPEYVLLPLVAYGPLLIISVAATRKWFMPNESSRSRAQLAAVYFPAACMVIMMIAVSVLHSYRPAEWQSLKDWKVYLALSMALFFPAVTMIVYTRSLPDVHHKKASSSATISAA